MAEMTVPLISLALGIVAVPQWPRRPRGGAVAGRWQGSPNLFSRAAVCSSKPPLSETRKLSKNLH